MKLVIYRCLKEDFDHAIKVIVGSKSKLSHSATGAPKLIGDERVITISHALNYTFFAICDFKIAIDVEYLDSSFLNKIPKSMYTQTRTNQKNFFIYWTRLEAYLKFIEQGIQKKSDIMERFVLEQTVLAEKLSLKTYRIKNFVITVCANEASGIILKEWRKK